MTESDYLEQNPLNSICYMWWDIIPFYGKSGVPRREMLDELCLEVMRRTLALDSIACQESALHGLDHWQSAYPEEVEGIIDNFLKNTHAIDKDLREYALQARTGMVQ